MGCGGEAGDGGFGDCLLEAVDVEEEGEEEG